MSTDKTTLIRKALCTVVSFILCLCLFILAIAATLGVATSHKYFLWSLDKSGYAELSLNSLLTELADLTIPSGLPIDFFDDKLDRDLYAERVEASFRANLTKSELPYTKEEITEEFFAWSIDYAEAHADSISSESEKALKQFSVECATRYMRSSNPSSVKTVISYFTKLSKPLLIAGAVVLVIGAITAVLLIVLNKKRGGVKYFFFSAAGASLLLGLAPLLLLITKEVRKIGLSYPALYSITVTYVEGILSICLILAVILLITAATILLAPTLLSKIKKKAKA